MFNFPLNLTKNTLKEGKKQCKETFGQRVCTHKGKQKKKALRGSQEIIDY